MNGRPSRLDADVEGIVAAFQASDCTELHIRFPGFELHLSTETTHQDGESTTRAIYRQAAAENAPLRTPTASPAPGNSSVPAAIAAPVSGATLVRAPYLGIFYRAPKPGDAPYVTLGQTVGAGADLCLIEVMKLFTAVRAPAAGTIAQILAEDGAMVEADQPLFAIAPPD